MIPYYVATYAIGTAILLYFVRETKSFLASYPSIENPDGLEAFKHLVRRNMIVALPYGFFMLSGAATGIHLTLQNPVTGVSLFATANIPWAWTALMLHRLETQSRNLPCADPVFTAEYHSITRAWRKGLWPKF